MPVPGENIPREGIENETRFVLTESADLGGAAAIGKGMGTIHFLARKKSYFLPC